MMEEFVPAEPTPVDGELEIELSDGKRLKVREFDGRQIRVVYPDGAQREHTIGVNRCDPNGRDAGKSFAVLHHQAFDTKHEEAASSEPEIVHFSEEYLSPAALNRIDNDEELTNRFLLDLTT